MYKLFFPFPIHHTGLFQHREHVTTHYKEVLSSNSEVVFRNSLPNLEEIKRYTELLDKNSLSKEYFGSLFTDDDSWKIKASLADLDNLHRGFTTIVDGKVMRSYFMTNCAGHHSDNQHYELFCPLNQLFFIVEYLNYYDNFPEIVWVDIDAHFGNGDKKLWDHYKQKMLSEKNNVRGLSFHNDAGNIEEDGYKGIGYEYPVLESQFVDMVRQETPSIVHNMKYLLLFWGTDVFMGDYGKNENITTNCVPEILNFFEELAQASNSQLIVIQTGGSQQRNIETLIDVLLSER
jgi:acetoin utilization deacetylase AcuC-like enzyme